MTNHPVRFIGRVARVPTPILSLAHVQAVCRFEREVDLGSLPTLISGGDRKARQKAVDEQRSPLRAPRRVQRKPWLAAYGDLAYHCRCGYTVLIADEGVYEPVECDRCHAMIGV